MKITENIADLLVGVRELGARCTETDDGYIYRADEIGAGVLLTLGEVAALGAAIHAADERVLAASAELVRAEAAANGDNEDAEVRRAQSEIDEANIARCLVYSEWCPGTRTVPNNDDDSLTDADDLADADEAYQIVIARVVTDVLPACLDDYVRDLPPLRSVRPLIRGEAILWSRIGTKTKLAQAGAMDGWRVYQCPASEADPLGWAKARVMRDYHEQEDNQ